MKTGHRPDSRYLAPLSKGRFLEIAEGNDEQEFGRGVCLSLNDAIVAIAKAGEGGALYWRQEGPDFTLGRASESGCDTRCDTQRGGCESGCIRPHPESRPPSRVNML